MAKKILKSNILFYVIICALATTVFIGTYGISIINPTNIDLWYQRGDWTQHYFGWVGFRNSEWQIPLGLYDNNTYPDSTSIIFTDSIPIVAVFFKIFRGILPVDFQYFGLFTWCCYIAQAVIVARIVKRICKDKTYAAIAALLFSFATIVIHRAFIHEALSAQFLILFMIETMLFARKNNIKTTYIRCGICAILAAGIHMYFVLICGVVLIGVCIEVFFNKKKYHALLLLIEYVCASFVVVWIEGGFSSGIDASKDNGFGAFNANLNALYNPLGKSIFLNDLDVYTWGQCDGSSYLGMGGFGLIIIVIIMSIISHNKIKEITKNNKSLMISIIVVVCIAMVFAIIPNITINDKLLFSINLPDFIEGLISNFRCNARTVWIVYYVVMLILVLVFYKCVNNYWASVVMAVIVVVQVIDLSGYLAYKYKSVNEIAEIQTEFNTEPFVEELAKDESIENVVLCGERFFERGDYDSTTDVYVWAIDNNKTTNYMYLAREERERLDKREQEALENPKEEYLYILSNEDEEKCQNYGLNYVKIGRYIFARLQPFE